MSLISLQSLFDLPGALLAHIGKVYGSAFLAVDKSFTLPSLIAALVVALLFVIFHRRRRVRPISLKVLMRALFPRRLVFSASTRADLGFFVLNTLLITSLLGWAVLSAHQVAKFVNHGLIDTFGQLQPTTLGGFWVAVIATAVLFLAAEFGYFLDHYLSHKIPFLWEFHKVHHTAEVLTPLTNFRVHPIDSLVYYNIIAVVLGLTSGLLDWSFGKSAVQFTLFNVNVFVMVWIYTLGELQHSQFWIAFTGTWGKFLLSPAHHQIHHSTNPIHFDRNMGNSLAIFDWMFGTLVVPSSKREKLTFGVEPRTADPNTISESLIAPVGAALRHLVPKATHTCDGTAAETAAGTPVTS